MDYSSNDQQLNINYYKDVKNVVFSLVSQDTKQQAYLPKMLEKDTTALRMQTAVTAHFSIEQLPLFAFAPQNTVCSPDPGNKLFFIFPVAI